MTSRLSFSLSAAVLVTFWSLLSPPFAADDSPCGRRPCAPFQSQRTPARAHQVFRLRNGSQTTDDSRRRQRPSDHLLDGEAIERRDSEATPMAVANTHRYRERGMRKRVRQQTSTTSTTTTTTTTTATPEDYYEYDDYYDDEYVDDLTTTTTTTTTTVAPQKRRRGRRRFRRPMQTTSPPTTTTTTTTLSPGYKPRSDGRVIDYQADPNWPYELRLPTADLTEYPFFVSIPESKFECRGRHDGYYADVALGCQVYHHCAVGHQRYDFLCPNYTLFDQTTFTCRFVNTVNCLASESHYNRNDALYPIPTTTTTTAPTTPTTAPTTPTTTTATHT